MRRDVALRLQALEHRNACRPDPADLARYGLPPSAAPSELLAELQRRYLAAIGAPSPPRQ